MLDYRHETFLTLYKIGSYTKAAQELHLTQPAVTQHIQYLESYYHCKLFCYRAKQLTPTNAAHTLFSFACAMRADSEQLRLRMVQSANVAPRLSFGATLTIGEYIMPKIIGKLLSDNDNLQISMQVDNTKTLLARLLQGEVDFVILEGFFNADDYASRLLSQAEFVPVCSTVSPYAKGRFTLKELLPARLITREQGSGTREVLEQVLTENNLAIDGFEHICEVGNISAIKQLTAQNCGIAFLYKAACAQELACGSLVQIKLPDITIYRAFNFVYLKDSLRIAQLEHYCSAIQALL